MKEAKTKVNKAHIEAKVNKTETEIKLKFNIMAVILICIFCFAITPVTLQNDTFYTIRIGEHILQNGIDMQDPFSWHEDLVYIYPHWLYTIIMYLTYSLGGMAGIYIFTVILSMTLGLTLYITSYKLIKNRVLSFLLTIGAMFMMQNYIAARAQLPTFILFVLTVYCIEMFLQTKKKRYAISLLIIPTIIVNLHAAVFPFYFILFLPYVADYLIHLLGRSGIVKNEFKLKRLERNKAGLDSEGLKDKTEKIKARIEVLTKRKAKAEEKPYKIVITKNSTSKWLILVMLIALGTGFLTPIGTVPYTYVYNKLVGETTQFINEHLPLILVNNVNFIAAIILFLGILIFTDTKIRLCDLFMLGGLIALTFYSRRQESKFILLGVFILIRLINAMFVKYDPEGCKKLERLAVRLSGQIVVVSLILALSIHIYRPKMEHEFISTELFPVQAAQFILDYLDIENMRLYNEYNYGSYLIYRGIPVFIDSRASLYAPEFNPGVTVFRDFMNISGVNVTNIEEKFDNYGITHLIMFSNARLRVFINQSPQRYVNIYDDGRFVIYERMSGYSV